MPSREEIEAELNTSEKDRAIDALRRSKTSSSSKPRSAQRKKGPGSNASIRMHPWSIGWSDWDTGKRLAIGSPGYLTPLKTSATGGLSHLK
jgi:hypothetical protein